MEESKRERGALTAGVESRLLEAVARRVPPGIRADHLTLLGVFGAIGVATGYARSGIDPRWLWVASVMLVVNWLGDSLDGSIARIRHAQRPRYGYYLDHGVDAFTTTLIGLGIGLSPFVSVYVGFAIVIVYLMMSINVYLESKVYNVFRMDYGPVGPTEARIILIAGNTLLFWAGRHGWGPERIEPTATVVCSGLVGVMALLLFTRFAANLRRLGREDPLPGPAGEPSHRSRPSGRDPGDGAA